MAARLCSASVPAAAHAPHWKLHLRAGGPLTPIGDTHTRQRRPPSSATKSGRKSREAALNELLATLSVKCFAHNHFDASKATCFLSKRTNERTRRPGNERSVVALVAPCKRLACTPAAACLSGAEFLPKVGRQKKSRLVLSICKPEMEFGSGNVAAQLVSRDTFKLR